MKREVKILGLSYSQSQVGSYVCVLSETNGSRKMPVIVKMQDAQTIALRVEGMESPRPLTHDLLKSFADSFLIDCQEIQIYKVLEGIFYAKLILHNGVDDSEIESTAGDAIALSLVFDCPLYVDEEVLNMCGVVTDDSGEIKGQKKPRKNKKKAGNVMSVVDLKRMMEDAIKNEEYELAAELRDKISQIEGK